MPELPEVETIVRGLKTKITGKTIARAGVLHPKPLGGKTPGQLNTFVKNQSVSGVTRFGKYIRLELASGRRLVCHLRMTGKFIYQPIAQTSQELLKHVRLAFHFTDNSCLLFKDIRIFGTVRMYESGAAIPEEQSVGREPLSAGFTPEYLLAKARGRRIALKVLLLDQKVIAGLGNIYACEILFHAGINPLLQAAQLTPAQATRLVEKVKSIIKLAIRHNGTSISDFRNVDNKSGKFQSLLMVYQQTGKLCSKCGQGIIRRIVQAQRATFFCPVCQG